MSGLTDAGRESLESYGWDRYFEVRFAALGRPSLAVGRVVQTQRGSLKLRTATGLCDALVPGRRYHGADSRVLPVVGDWVAFEDADGGPVVIAHVLTRRTRLSRKAAGARSVEQVVAANVDLVLLVMGLDGDFSLRRLERLLAVAEESDARSAVVLNKADLCADLPERLGSVRALAAGRPTLAISALDGDLDALELLLRPGETVALLGSSGAGKSTLINRLLGADEQATQPVRKHDSRGRHTTSHRELFRLPGGCLVIDNPGVREIQPWSVEESLPVLFDDIEELARGCRFSDCSHGSEPGCAVQAAIAGGELEASRLDNQQRLEREAIALELRKDARAHRESDRKTGKLYKRIQQEKRRKKRS